MDSVIAWKPSSLNQEVASARLRGFLPCAYLREIGWRCEIFKEANADRYRLVIFQKLYDEESINLATSLNRQGVKTVFDLCDNHFYNPDGLPILHERAERLQKMIDIVDMVAVSTPELGKLIKGKRHVVIDDALDPLRHNPVRDCYLKLSSRLRRGWDKSFHVVWYGIAGSESPQFGLIDLPKVLPSLEALHTTIPLTLTVISNSQAIFEKYVGEVSFPVKYYNWQQSTFPYIFRQQDVCIIPININPFTICKTNNRLALSLLMGVPVVADRIPSYEEFNDYVLFSDWETNLRAYAVNRKLRQQHVSEGSAYIRAKYNQDRVVAQWSSLFQAILK